MRVPEKNWLEWAVFALGILCIGAVVAFLAKDALQSAHAPAHVVVRLGQTEERAGQRHVPVTLLNSGGEAAAGVQVEVLLERDSEIVERARFVMDLIPRGATREGWVAFESPVAPGDRIRTGGVAFGGP